MLKWFKKPKKKESKREQVLRHRDILKDIISLPVRKAWLDDETIEKILRDSTVESSMGSRKAATLRKEIIINTSNEEYKTKLEKTFSFNILDCILDTPYFGFNVFEVNWYELNGILYPQLKDRDYKDFTLENGVLKFSPNGISEDIPRYKAIHSTYRTRDKNPYGRPIINTLFWLIEFKNASLEFWVELLEKFGTPWVIGKTDGDKDAFADEIYNMLGGDGAVLEQDDELEIVTANQKGSYKELIEYIDNQIRQLILGGNLTSLVKGGSLAAALVHNNIREDLAKADENIVNKLISQTIDYFKAINSIDEDIEGYLKDKDDPNKELCERDKIIADMGYKPTQEYIENTYNIKVEPCEPLQANNLKNSNNIYALSKLPQDELDFQGNKIDYTKPFTFQMQILKTLENATSYEEALDLLSKLYVNIDLDDIRDSLEQMITNSSILGVAKIEEENPHG